MNLGQLIEGLQPTVLKSASNKEGVYVHNFRIKTKVYFPHLREEHEVGKVSFNHEITAVKGFMVSANFDPYIEEKLHTSKASENQNTFDIVIEAGKFYYNPNLEFSYYCISVEEDSCKIICVESYQHGELFQFIARMSIEAQKYLVEITDSNEIERLKRVGNKIFTYEGITF